MAQQDLLTIQCPCCDAEIVVDKSTGAVIRHKAPDKPREVADMEAAMERYKGEAGRREDAFAKGVADHKNRDSILNKKFDEMLRLAKEDPDSPPPKRDIDFD